MGVPNSEVGYTSATAGGGETTKSERICGGHLKKIENNNNNNRIIFECFLLNAIILNTRHEGVDYCVSPQALVLVICVYVIERR